MSIDTYDPNTLDQYEYERSSGWFRRFLWRCAGADAQLLSKCPESERIKEEGIGGIVLATAILATCSGSFALYTVFSDKTPGMLSHPQPGVIAASVAFGIVWGLMIFNLDRFVVSSTGHGDGTEHITWSEFAHALPRIAMAILIGITVSKPLEIQIMKSELDAEAGIVQREWLEKPKAQLEADFQREKGLLDSRRKAAEQELARLQGIADQTGIEYAKRSEESGNEAAGKPGAGRTGQAGVGPALIEKRRVEQVAKEAAERAAETLKSERPRLEKEIADNNRAVDELRAHRDAAVKDATQQSYSKGTGLMERIHMADRMYPIGSFLLMMLFMIIEIAPIFFKMMIRTGPFEHLRENQNRMALARHRITEKRGATAQEGVEGEYHMADLVAAFNIGQLKVEQHLSAVAQEVFRGHKEQELRSGAWPVQPPAARAEESWNSEAGPAQA